MGPGRGLLGRNRPATGVSTAWGSKTAATDTQGRRQYGGQRGPLWPRQLDAVGDGRPPMLERLGQLYARLLHADRRHGAIVQHHARRGDHRRVGSGLYGMLLFAIVAVFIAGLMVGRTPEYLGKKIEAKEVKMSVLALILILPLKHPGLYRAGRRPSRKG